MRNREATRQEGFSMAELLVALVVTGIIGAAIFQLLAAGQSAFQREPQLTDRQQNIRIAMDAIRRDVTAAGGGMVPFVQAFTNGLDGAGPPGPSTLPGEANTDRLQILSAATCRMLWLLAPVTAPTGSFASNEGLPDCYPDNSEGMRFFYLGGVGGGNDLKSYGVALARADAPHGNPAPPTVLNGIAAGSRPAAGFCAGGCNTVDLVNVVEYRIEDLGDPNFPGLTGLWRSETGGLDNAGNAVDPPGANWQLVAMGIEDLQVTYTRAGVPGITAATPGLVTCGVQSPTAAELGTIVREVTITLGARVSGVARMHGQTDSPVGRAVRGRLTTTVAPRAALLALTQNTTAPRGIRGVHGGNGEDAYTLAPGESGYALILAILSLLLLTFLGLTLAATTTTELQIATSYKWSSQAAYNAEAGIEAGKRILQDLNWELVLPAARAAAAMGTPPAVPFPGATRNFEMAECDDRGKVGLGVVLHDGVNIYENVTTVPGLGAQPLAGNFTLWVRRQLAPPTAAGGSYTDLTDNGALVLTAMGVAPYVGPEVGSLMRTQAARQFLEVEVQRQGATPPCETRGGQASGGPEGNNYVGGCTGLDDDALAGHGFITGQGGTGRRVSP